LLAVVGPTASGKSSVAAAIAAKLGAEVLSVDSMQVYRGMDIGTAKARPELQRSVPHHLIDIVDPGADYSVADFQAAGRRVLADLDAREVPGVICGGSGLHFRALVDPLEFPPRDLQLRRNLELMEPGAARAMLLEADPGAGAHVDLDNPRRVVRALEVLRLTGSTPSARAASPQAAAVRAYRPRYDFVAVGLDAGDALASRAAARLDLMLAAGLLDEIAVLRGRLGRIARQAVGYKELLPVVAGECSLKEGRDAALRATLALAKRQRTFFRRDPRIQWITWRPDAAERVQAVSEYLEEAGAWTS
jgi:tRNA dimethylallyltransferase